MQDLISPAGCRKYRGRSASFMKAQEKFEDVHVICKANIFFEDKVVSHTVLLKDGSKKTL